MSQFKALGTFFHCRILHLLTYLLDKCLRRERKKERKRRKNVRMYEERNLYLSIKIYNSYIVCVHIYRHTHTHTHLHTRTHTDKNKQNKKQCSYPLLGKPMRIITQGQISYFRRDRELQSKRSFSPFAPLKIRLLNCLGKHLTLPKAHTDTHLCRLPGLPFICRLGVLVTLTH